MSATAATTMPTSTPSPGPVVVLGVGNVLMADDGVGVRVVAALEAERAAGRLDLPAGVDLVDGGTASLALLPWLAEARAAVIVDAAIDGGAAGTVAVWRDGEVAERPAGRDGGSESPLGELLAVARLAGALPAAVSLVGIEPRTVAPGEHLSGTVAAAVPAAVEATLAEIRRVDALSGGGARPPRSLPKRHGVTS